MEAGVSAWGARGGGQGGPSENPTAPPPVGRQFILVIKLRRHLVDNSMNFK